MKTIIDGERIRHATKKASFRNLFPELKERFDAYIQKPGCGACWRDLLEGILEREDMLREYFGDVEIQVERPEARPENRGGFHVIPDVSIYDLEDALNKLPPGPKQIQAARYEDRITVIVNVLE